MTQKLWGGEVAGEESKQTLIFRELYVGQDLAFIGPSASRTESYLIISMATAVGLE